MNYRLKREAGEMWRILESCVLLFVNCVTTLFPLYSPFYAPSLLLATWPFYNEFAIEDTNSETY